MRILIVEDEPTLGPQLKSTLEQTGEQVVDPRLDVFRDFVNSLDVDADQSGRATRPGGREVPRLVTPFVMHVIGLSAVGNRHRHQVLAWKEPRHHEVEVCHQQVTKRGYRSRGGQRVLAEQLLAEAVLDIEPDDRLP